MKETILAMKLKEYREKNKLTQSMLAELLEVSDKTISKWELGATYPSKKNMIKIAEELDISLETLLLEETKKDNDDLKVSIKYGVISFCLIFFVTMIVTSFNQDFSRIMNLSIQEKFGVLLTTALKLLSISVPPAIIIGSVFYFYIFPKNKKENEPFPRFRRKW